MRGALSKNGNLKIIEAEKFLFPRDKKVIEIEEVFLSKEKRLLTAIVSTSEQDSQDKKSQEIQIFKIAGKQEDTFLSSKISIKNLQKKEKFLNVVHLKKEKRYLVRTVVQDEMEGLTFVFRKVNEEGEFKN